LKITSKNNSVPPRFILRHSPPLNWHRALTAFFAGQVLIEQMNGAA
jgi:hypothetical protein